MRAAFCEVSMVKDELDGPVSRALEALEAVSRRDLIRAAQALERRRDTAGLDRFDGVFRSLANGRQLGGDQWLARLQLRAAVILAVLIWLSSSPRRRIRSGSTRARR